MLTDLDLIWTRVLGGHVEQVTSWGQIVLATLLPTRHIIIIIDTLNLMRIHISYHISIRTKGSDSNFGFWHSIYSVASMSLGAVRSQGANKLFFYNFNWALDLFSISEKVFGTSAWLWRHRIYRQGLLHIWTPQLSSYHRSWSSIIR